MLARDLQSYHDVTQFFAAETSTVSSCNVTFSTVDHLIGL